MPMIGRLKIYTTNPCAQILFFIVHNPIKVIRVDCD